MFKKNHKNVPKRVLAILSVVLLITVLAACGSSHPCESSGCNQTPTKGYKNEYTEETEYYCKKCSSNCAFCSGKATKHYTSGIGMIIFACEDCYKDIQSLNSK